MTQGNPRFPAINYDPPGKKSFLGKNEKKKKKAGGFGGAQPPDCVGVEPFSAAESSKNPNVSLIQSTKTY